MPREDDENSPYLGNIREEINDPRNKSHKRMISINRSRVHVYGYDFQMMSRDMKVFGPAAGALGRVQGGEVSRGSENLNSFD